MSDEAKPLGLIRKLAEVMAETGYVKKAGTNQKQGYKYVTEADVLDAIREGLAKRHVVCLPSVESVNRSVLYKSSTGNDVHVTDVMVRWSFLDGETGEVHECLMPGCGTDTGDKGIYKAITGSSKYMFLKGLMLPTGDDPENDTGTKEAAQAVAQRKVAEYSERAAASVTDKTVYLIRGTKKDLNGDPLPIVYLEASTATALLLDAGLKLTTIYDDKVKMHWVAEETLDMPDGVRAFATANGVKLVIRDAVVVGSHPPVRPAAKEPAAKPSPKNAAAGPVIEACSEILNGKKGKFFSIQWNGHKMNCFHADWQPHVVAGVGKPAVFTTVTNGQYVNLDEIVSIDGIVWHEGAPVRQQELL